MNFELKTRWSSPGGYKELLDVAIPLILSMASISILMFIDRVFLSWYATDALAATMPAGGLCFSLMCFFMGTATYAGTFISQYYGAQKYHLIGPAMWQGVYVALAGGLLMPCIAPFAPTIFAFIGHEKSIQIHEVKYFQILCMGAIPYLVNTTFAGFYSGRGMTRPVMWINFFTASINILLDYCWIFGRLGFPEKGISGAALATISATCCTTFVYFFLLSRPKNNQQFKTLEGWRFQPKAFKRLLSFGIPAGIQFFLDVSGFHIFLLMVGRLGTVQLAASNIMMQVNMLGLLPMIGMGITVSILVGRYIGSKNVSLAEKSVYSALQLTFIYNSVMASLYITVPMLFILPFVAGMPEPTGEIQSLTKSLLLFAALFTFFDSFHIMSSSALKGAGDTRFVMRVMGLTSLFGLLIPAYIIIEIMTLGIYAAWSLATGFVCLMGVIFFLRFLGGKWKEMQVID